MAGLVVCRCGSDHESAEAEHFEERASTQRSLHYAPPGFPVKTRGFEDLHAALSTESRTRGRCQRREAGNPGTLRSR